MVIPAGADDAAVRARLLTDFNLEIGAGLGALAGKVWRIGLMGHACSARNVEYCLSSLEQVLREQGAKINTGVAVEAARVIMHKNAPAAVSA